jgi:hypothetical protein
MSFIVALADYVAQLYGRALCSVGRHRYRFILPRTATGRPLENRSFDICNRCGVIRDPAN